MPRAKPLKSMNLAWLWGFITVDIAALVLLSNPEVVSQVTMKEFASMRALVAGVAPVIVLLLASLLPSEVKAALVFWRHKDTLPGHRAFSVYATKDTRIDLDALRKNIGAFPKGPREQNTTWYKLYKKVESDVTVAQAHRHYLLFRDLTAISLLLAPISALVLYFLSTSVNSSCIAFGLLGTQYVAVAVAARHNGVRLVTNVLALHAVKRRS